MIALIPGITSALTSLQPQPAASPAPQDGFPASWIRLPRAYSLGSPRRPRPRPVTRCNPGTA